MIETDIWPFVPARWFTHVDAPRPVQVIVVHDMEYPERSTAAEDVAKYFADPRDDSGNPVKASAHVCVDNDSIVQCVHDHDVAYAAPGCNNDGIQIEIAGYLKQDRADWLDAYGVTLLDNVANVVAQYCLKYDIPAVHLTNEQLAAGGRGIIGHVQASQVYKKSDHQDPGPNFPWDVLMTGVAKHAAERVALRGS